jgi:hypothetical protein
MRIGEAAEYLAMSVVGVRKAVEQGRFGVSAIAVGAKVV